MKTVKKAEKFLEFCKKHPNYRFWQALLAFTETPYALISDRPPRGNYKNEQGEEIYLQDTFFLD